MSDSSRARVMHRFVNMGMLLVMALVVFIAIVIALGVHGLRADRSEERHRWLAVVPVLIIFGWVLEQLIMG